MSQAQALDTLYAKYQEAEDRADYAYMVMQADWTERQNAREKMNQAKEQMKQLDAHYYTVWGQYNNLRDSNNHRIETLQHEAKYASKSRQDEIDAEISELLREIRNAKREAKKKATIRHKTFYRQAERAFHKAKVHHEDSMMEYEYYKAMSDKYKAMYDQAKANYDKDNQPPN